MSEKIDIDVAKVAKLARLKLNKEEEEYITKQFQDILGYVGQISEVEIDSGMKEKDESLQKIYHQDISEKSDVQPEQFSEQVENNFFKVPKVIE